MIRAASARAIREAGRQLLAGGLVAFPTETVYGLGAHALDERAVERIFRAKRRPHYDPLIVHVADEAMLAGVAVLDGAAGRRAAPLMRRCWPGPLTLVLPKSPFVPGLVTAGLPTVAVRVPAHPTALALIRAAGVPVAAPSANRFGRLSPVTAAHVEEQLGPEILVLDDGRTTVGVESTIVDLTGREPRLLRPGGLPLEVVEEILGRRVRAGRRKTAAAAGLPAPGMLRSHYAPQTPLVLLAPARFRARLAAALDGRPGDAGFLCWRRPAGRTPPGVVRWLSATGDDDEACRNLYAALHDLDGAGLARIVVERPPATGLGRAALDRLRRAATRA